MARGWESKSVESQIESAETKRPGTPTVSPEQLRLNQERASLEMTRTRVLRDLAATNHPRHREQVEAALKHLDEKIAAIDSH